MDTAMEVGPAESAWAFSYYHFHDTSPAAPIKQGCPLQDNRWLRIGLPTLRDRCPHFARWLTRLETL